MSSLDISEKGQRVWLKDFGEVELFRTRLKDELHHYILFLPEKITTPLVNPISNRCMISIGKLSSITE